MKMSRKDTAETQGKLRLMHIVESFGGGVLHALSMMCRCLDKDKFDVTLIYSKRQETPADFKGLFPEHIKFRMIDMTREISPGKDFISFLRIIRALKSVRPDIVHLHSSKAGFLARVACKLLNIRRVYYSPHGFSFLRTDIGNGKRKFYFRLEKFAALFGSTIVACSPSEAAEALRLSKKTATIANVVDIDAVDRIEPFPRDEPALWIGISGRITYQKAPEMFAQVAKEVSGKTSNVKFVWIGDGELRDVVADADIEITGWKGRQEAIGRMKALDIYLHTSQWEGMPVTVLEAMACGLPVVCTDIIGNRDAVIHGVTGYLAKTRDELVKYLLELIRDSNLREKQGLAGRRTVENKFGLESLSNALEKLYSNAHV